MMILNNIMYICRQGCRKYIGLFSLLLALVGCQDFTDDTASTMPDPNLKFADATLKLTQEEKEYTVNLESNLPWRVKTAAAWIELLTSNGMGTGNFKIAVTKNTEVASREAEIAAWIIEGAETKLKVVQEGIGIALKKRTLKVGAKGSEAEVIPFSTMVAYTYELSDPACNWVHVTDGGAITPGIVNDLELTLKIDPYMDTDEGRTVDLYLKGANGVTDVLTITQDQKPLEDIDYLRMFYEGANGENWKGHWNFDAPLVTNATNWPGVTFTNGRVTAINFSGTAQFIYGINGDITPLCYLSELTSLQFKRQLIPFIPEEIGQLTNLTTLMLAECGVTGGIPKSISNCQSLQVFNISNDPTITPSGYKYNEVEGDIHMLFEIPGIVTIKAYDNKLSGTIPGPLVNENNQPIAWKNLKEFMIDWNGFTGGIPAGYGTIIEKSGSAGYFRVHENQLSGQIPADIKAWSKYATYKQTWILKGNNLTE